MSTRHTSRLLVHAIDPARLNVVRTTGEDAHGNQLRPFATTGQGEPLRCCLRYAEPGEQITLISHAPFERPSVWREVGPVYILPTYRADDIMNYEHNTVVTDEADLQRVIERLVSKPDVTTVHVRTLAPQCFLYAVSADWRDSE